MKSSPKAPPLLSLEDRGVDEHLAFCFDAFIRKRRSLTILGDHAGSPSTFTVWPLSERTVVGKTRRRRISITSHTGSVSRFGQQMNIFELGQRKTLARTTRRAFFEFH